MDKWTPDLWLTSTLAEQYQGAENMTSPAAAALLAQSNLASSPPSKTCVVLDNGAGLGQLTEVLLADAELRGKVKELVVGDVDDSLLDAVRAKKEKGRWEEVQVKKIDTHAIGFPDNTFSHVFANQVYMLTRDPIQALKESIRVLQPGGTLGFTTWSSSGPFFLLKDAISRIPDAPKPPSAPPAPPSAAPAGSTAPPPIVRWADKAFILSTLTSLHLPEAKIKIEEYTFKQTASGPKDMARKMRPVVPIMTGGWPEEVKKTKGWEVFERIEEVMREKFGEVECWVESTALVVTAVKSS